MLLAVSFTFLISGFWHGAAWHFIAWGAFHGMLYIPSIFSKKGLKSMLKKENKTINISDIPSVIITFSLVCVGYILFRMPRIQDSINYIINISDIAQKPIFMSFFIYPILMIFLDVWLYKKMTSSKVDNGKLELYLLLPMVILMLIYHSTNQAEFIYFAF